MWIIYIVPVCSSLFHPCSTLFMTVQTPWNLVAPWSVSSVSVKLRDTCLLLTVLKTVFKLHHAHCTRSAVLKCYLRLIGVSQPFTILLLTPSLRVTCRGLLNSTSLFLRESQAYSPCPTPSPSSTCTVFRHNISVALSQF